MRGMFGRLCHGRERQPLEPYGVAAPLLRMLACGALFVAASSGLLTVALVLVEAPERVYGRASYVMVVGAATFVVLRVWAMFLRPSPVAATRWRS